MALVADGDLELDEPIGTHVPELAAGDLTLRQLLTHTSGLEAGPDGGPSTRRYIGALTTIQPPGLAFSYSNAGYVLVGRLIEAVTGMTWWAAVESIVLRPLGIEPAFVVGPVTSRPIARGHSVNNQKVLPVEQNITLAEAPAGAIAASATDLVTLGLELLDNEEMRTPHTDAFGLADSWGLGLALYEGWAGHDGTSDGTWCHLRFDPTSRTVVALTTNANTGLGVWHDVALALGVPSGSMASVPVETVPPPKHCFGTYLNGDLEYSIVNNDRSQLVFAVDGDPQAEITFHPGLTFSLRDTQTGQSVYTGRCLVDAAGRIDRIQVNGRVAIRSRQLP